MCRSHSCVLFATQRVTCWGAEGDSYGQIGRTAKYSVSGNASSGTDIGLSTLDYIVFSDSNMPITDISAGDTHTCVMFANGETVCFGNEADGRLGNNNAASNIGFGSAVSSAPSIAFSQPAVPLGAVIGSWYRTCVIRCDGYIMCFGMNTNGMLGTDNSISYGSSAGNPITSLNSMVFNTANIPVVSLSCPVILTSLTDSASSPVFASITPGITFYLIDSPNQVQKWTVLSVVTKPTTNSVTMNSLPLTSWITLSYTKLTKVYLLQDNNNINNN